MQIKSFYSKALVAAALGACSQAGLANDFLSPLVVIGSKDRVLDLVGSAAYLDKSDMDRQHYENINRLLAKVPGVYIREEDGYGNFPNISLRGNLGTRSEKSTIMEDGILMVPAPYSAPAAYYSPNAARMSAFEVMKGSSQVKYGPNSTGGVINYLSTPIPQEATFYGKFLYGSDATFSGHAYYGDTIETEAGTFGYLLEMYYKQTDGFRKIQGHAGRNTGFHRSEPMLKLSWEPKTDLKQKFEFKIGYTDFDADESYLGMTREDLGKNPYGRYAATMFDNIDTLQTRTYLRYSMDPRDNLHLEATAYYNRFNRNWYKLNKINGTSLHKALINTNLVTGLQGLTAGDILDIKANNRDYYSYGVQFAGTYSFTTGALDHSLDLGLRLHKDRIRRFQWVDKYASDGNGSFNLSSLGVHGSDSNRRQETKALSAYVEDSIKTGKWTFRPGIRLEWMDYHYQDYKKHVDLSDTLALLSGGAGFSYAVSDEQKVFGGIYRGVSTPSPQGYTATGSKHVDEETSIAYELGIRHYDANKGFRAELVGFYTDYDNLIAPATGLGLGQVKNGGAARVYGIEALLTYDLASSANKSFSLPVYLSATWTKATLTKNLDTDSGNIFTDFRGGNEDGKDMPYIPEWKIAAGIGLDMTQWGANLDVTYVSSMYGTAGNYKTALVSAREGKIDDSILVDLSAWYKINDNWKLIAGIQNVFDEEDVVSLIPEGARMGRGRHFYAGFEVQF